MLQIIIPARTTQYTDPAHTHKTWLMAQRRQWEPPSGTDRRADKARLNRGSRQTRQPCAREELGMDPFAQDRPVLSIDTPQYRHMPLDHD